MAEFQIYHNPRCRKSRAAKQVLDEKGVDYEVIEYLKQPPSEQEIRELLQKLGLSVREIIRTKEKIYKELNLKQATDDELIRAIAEHPILLERPIIVRGDRAVLARPTENIDKIL